MTKKIFLMTLMIVFASFAFAADPNSATASAPANATATATVPATAPTLQLMAMPPRPWPVPWECCCASGCSNEPDKCCYSSEECCKKGAVVLDRLAALAAGKETPCAGKVAVYQFGAEPKRSVVFKQ